MIPTVAKLQTNVDQINFLFTPLNLKKHKLGIIGQNAHMLLKLKQIKENKPKSQKNVIVF
jgi:hypothetical protein